MNSPAGEGRGKADVERAPSGRRPWCVTVRCRRAITDQVENHDRQQHHDGDDPDQRRDNRNHGRPPDGMKTTVRRSLPPDGLTGDRHRRDGHGAFRDDDDAARGILPSIELAEL